MNLRRLLPRILGCALVAFAIQSTMPAIAAAQTLAPLVLQGGTLIDATGRDPIEDAVIVSLIPSATTMKPQDIINTALVLELEKEGRCSF